jgi:hypothetical protein
MWTQVVGKVALACAAPLNHSWGVALHLTATGLTTPLLTFRGRPFTIAFDFVEHRLDLRTSDGERRSIALRSQPVAEFYRAVMNALHEMSLPVKIWPMPVEVPAPIRFDEDVVHHTYDPEAVERCWTILSSVAPVLDEARCGFIGKCSPVHFFWGSFDLAVTRFSGRPAPPRDGPRFMRDAYSHEVISHGFWFGSGPVLEPALYAYAVPQPEGLAQAAVQPPGAYYHQELGEFILPYAAAVHGSTAPGDAIRAFVGSTYDAAASLAQWNRDVLERATRP